MPGRLDQRPPRAPVARQGEALSPDRIAGRTVRPEGKEGHRLSWRIEPRTSPISAAKVTATETMRRASPGRLPRLAHGPLRHDESELLLEAAQALERIFDGVDAFLKDDLLRGMLEFLMSQPAPMRQRPMVASAVNPAVPQQKGKQLLAFAAKVVRRRLARPHKVAHRLMRPSGARTAVNSPARCSRASVTASRRFVLIRSPDRFGIRAGATTMQSWPRA